MNQADMVQIPGGRSAPERLNRRDGSIQATRREGAVRRRMAHRSTLAGSRPPAMAQGPRGTR